ncbi:cellulose binding domain-containing protein, partial [Micromonospora chersina]
MSSFDGGFIGEVRLVNTSGTARGWTVRLTFPRGRLVTAWVSGAEQGSGDFTDGVFTYRSGVDLAPGASVALQFHFEQTGTTQPTSLPIVNKLFTYNNPILTQHIHGISFDNPIGLAAGFDKSCEVPKALENIGFVTLVSDTAAKKLAWKTAASSVFTAIRAQASRL